MEAKQLIYKVALPVPLRRLFDYLPPYNYHALLPRGTRVKVPFGKREHIGIILDHSDTSLFSKEQLKNIIEICEPFALFPEELCDFIIKTARYYHYPIGEVTFTGSPLPLRQGKAVIPKQTLNTAINTSVLGLKLNADQQHAVETILQSAKQFQTFLLQGITGSGKTEVYLQATAQLLQEDTQILILVPEISLTPQTFQRFHERFGDLVIHYHSRMTGLQR